MITVRIKGGLGNQLFQYAAGYALEKELSLPMQMTKVLRMLIEKGHKLKEDLDFYSRKCIDKL